MTSGMAPSVHRILRWLPALLWVGIIYSWSSLSQTPTSNWYVSKLAHVTEYGLARPTRWALLSWMLCTGYAATDEYHQSFTPGRRPMVQDVLLDSAAAALALQVLRQLAHASETTRDILFGRRPHLSPALPGARRAARMAMPTRQQGERP